MYNYSELIKKYPQMPKEIYFYFLLIFAGVVIVWGIELCVISILEVDFFINQQPISTLMLYFIMSLCAAICGGTEKYLMIEMNDRDKTE